MKKKKKRKKKRKNCQGVAEIFPWEHRGRTTRVCFTTQREEDSFSFSYSFVKREYPKDERERKKNKRQKRKEKKRKEVDENGIERERPRFSQRNPVEAFPGKTKPNRRKKKENRETRKCDGKSVRRSRSMKFYESSGEQPSSIIYSFVSSNFFSTATLGLDYLDLSLELFYRELWCFRLEHYFV